MQGRIILLTGERGTGKSTLCQQVARLANEHGHRARGILTLRDDAGGDRRSVVDLSTGEQRTLTQDSGDRPVVQVGKYRFVPDVLTWGAQVLMQAAPCDLLIVDELGPLELRSGGGWKIALDVLYHGQFALALVVVRPALIVSAQMHCPYSAIVFHVAQHNRDVLPAVLMHLLERESHPQAIPTT